VGAPYITGKGFGILAGSWSQSGPEGSQGSTVALDLSDDNVESSWLVVVKAQTSQGEYILGAVRTRSPAAGDPKSRTILIAWHPGVTKWAFDFFGPVGATCRPIMSTDKCACGGAAFPIIPANGSRLERRIWTPSPSQPAFAQQGQLSLGPSALTKAYGFLEPAAAASLYVGFVDSLAPLVGGEPFIVAPAPVPNTWPRVFSFSFDPDGVPFAQAIRWAVSTSPLAVAFGAGGDVAIVQGERI
jgi:hypothetical protein